MQESNYLHLVDKILQNEFLCKAIAEIRFATNALDLITGKWKETLENYFIYQLHKNKKAKYNKGHACGTEKKAFVKKLIDKNQNFNIIVAGEWALKKSDSGDFSIVARSCDPLEEIGYAMQENEEKKLHTGGRFFIDECNPLGCIDCLREKGPYKCTTGKNWCVKSAKLYNGEQMVTFSTPQFQNILLNMGDFQGIFQMQIHTRNTFGENSYKIGGNISYMIVFQNNTLNYISKATYLPPPPAMPPTIEYPIENKELTDNHKMEPNDL